MGHNTLGWRASSRLTCHLLLGLRETPPGGYNPQAQWIELAAHAASSRYSARSHPPGVQSRLSVWDAADIWMSSGRDEDRMFGYTEEELRRAVEERGT